MGPRSNRPSKNHNMTNETTSWLIWESAVWDAAIAAVGNSSWVEEARKTQRHRLVLWYQAGEPIWMAADGLRQIANGLRLAERDRSRVREA